MSTELKTVIVHSDEALAVDCFPATHNVYWTPLPDDKVMFHFRPKDEPIPPGSTKVEIIV